MRPPGLPVLNPQVDVETVKDGVDAGDTMYGAADTAATAADALHKLDGTNGQAIKGFFDNPAIKGGEGALGTVLGGLSIADGVGEMTDGQANHKTRGAFDIAAGGLGMAGGIASLAEAGAFGAGAMGAGAAAGAALGPIGLVAGLAAAGNGYSQDHGWWGKNADGSNKDSIQWAAGNTANAYNAVNKWAGGGVGGTIAGGLAGLGVGVGSAGAALVGDVGAGALGVTEGLGNLVGGLFGNKKAGTGIADGITNFAGGAANAIGGGINSAAKTVGNIGSGIGNAIGGVGKALGGIHIW